MRRFVELFLLAAGLAGLGTWLWSNLRLRLFQERAGRALQRQAAAHPAAPRALADGALLGRLAIPRLNLAAVMLEGAGARSLDVALGHIPGTALPGQPGNVAIAGHRDTLFRALRRIQNGDLIRLETPSGSYTYRVESTGIVKPSDTWVLDAGRQPELTLVTCYPFYYAGPAPGRFIVKASLLTRSPADPPAPGIVMNGAWALPRQHCAHGRLRVAIERPAICRRDQRRAFPPVPETRPSSRGPSSRNRTARASAGGPPTACFLYRAGNVRTGMWSRADATTGPADPE